MKQTEGPKVVILAGSRSDAPLVEEGVKILEQAHVPYEVQYLSAHRDPERLRAYVQTLEERGVQVVIAVAGLAAHLPGVVASLTRLPVLGVPVDTGPLHGLDALLSIVQMPRGVPVGTLAIGKHGMINAALLALRILALQSPEIRNHLQQGGS